jgi:hypothetical protein
MSGYADGEGRAVLTEFRGVPNVPHGPGEKGRWRRFLEWAMPWLKQKWEMGEAVLAARVAQEQAKAKQMSAEAKQAEVKVAQDIIQTIAMARELEQEKLVDLDATVVPPEELRSAMESILAKLELLEWKHGARFHFSDDHVGRAGDTASSGVQSPGPERSEAP